MHTTTTASQDRRRLGTVGRRRALGLSVLTAALLAISACGGGSTHVDPPPTPAPSTIPDPTTSAASATPPTPAASATPATSAIPVIPSTTATTAARPTATIDQLVGPAERRVHVRCIGQGDTTVVLIAGFGSDSTAWAKVEPAIAAGARVCSYDRPGTGTSAPATSTATFHTNATDLRALLRSIGEPGPFVLVGHSFGGAEAVAFASQYPDEVTGLVLVDASPTTWPAALCAVADDGTDAAAVLRSSCTDTFQPSGNSEHLDVSAAFADVSRITSLGNLPMAVITAIDREFPAGLAAAEMTRLTDAWNQGQEAWVRLSTAAHLTSVGDTGHHIEIDQPDVVIDEITHLLP